MERGAATGPHCSTSAGVMAQGGVGGGQYARMAAPKGDLGNPWSSGLCACFDDCGVCCLGYWCPCVLYGKNAERISGQPGCVGHCCLWYLLSAFFGCACCVSGPTRNRLRAEQQLKDVGCCGDWCTHFWCGGCALCQEARQLNATSKGSAPAGAYAQPAGTAPMSVPNSQRMNTAV
ncbi:hypothetical protein WJX73_000720 [Symbiochloris irregularis]|uniref:Uncharacterized protein n=1 Tax=Symbiochloris irregularis TaxID=706552 RepID=A0AAW1NUK9_9CHLO